MRTRARQLGGIVLAAGVAGCSLPFPEYRYTDDPAAAARLRARIPRAPEGTRMTARAILTMRGMELPLTLRIWRKRPGTHRIIAADDLGGTPIHVVRRGDELVVVSRADFLDEAFVREGFCRDLSRWLFLHDTGDGRAAALPDGTPALAGADGSLLWASTAAGPVDRIASGTSGRLRSMIQIDWRDGQPTSVLIENHRFRFELSLEVKEWQPADLTPATFRTKR